MFFIIPTISLWSNGVYYQVLFDVVPSHSSSPIDRSPNKIRLELSSSFRELSDKNQRYFDARRYWTVTLANSSIVQRRSLMRKCSKISDCRWNVEPGFRDFHARLELTNEECVPRLRRALHENENAVCFSHGGRG